MESSWIDDELKGCTFVDQRLKKRYRKLVEQLSDGFGESIPMSCQDWASTKAAYRFFSNKNLSEEELLEGHFQSTHKRSKKASGPLLVLHDTSEFSYQRVYQEKIGITHKVASKKIGSQKRTVCGLLMHASLAITTEGVPLGLSALKFWTRKKFKGTNALKNKINSTRIPIEQKESIRWIESLAQSTKRLGNSKNLVHIGDRESDIYEFFSEAEKTESHFLIRLCVNRRTKEGLSTLTEEMAKAPRKGFYKTEYRDKKGNQVEAKLEIRFKKITLQPPIGEKQKRYPNISVVVIFAKEVGKVKGDRPRIEWKLMTNLPVSSLSNAIEKLQWYALRWKIEVYFNILKSGCKAEETKLRSAEGVTKLLSVFCILAWRVYWMTMISREDSKVLAKVVFTEIEIKILDKLKPTQSKTKKIGRAHV